MRWFLFALSLVASDALAQPAAPATPRFRAGTETIAIDVTVLDRQGVPVESLSAADFTVTVAGSGRTIQSAQFIRSEPSAPTPFSDASSNSERSSGRLLLIVVDEATLRASAHDVVKAAQGVMSRLGAADLVGIARIPDGGGVAFTTNRSRIVEELARLTPPRPQARRTDVTIHLSEALDYERTQRLQWPAAVRRECIEAANTAQARLCIANLEQAARTLVRDESIKTQNTARVLEELMKTLTATQQPVTMVLISESLFIAQDPGVVGALVAAAAEARVSLYVVQPASSGMELGAHGFSSDPGADSQLRSDGLELLASQSRGEFYRAVSTGAPIFDRISREQTSYYLLGIEPTAEDRRKRRLGLKVEVRRDGLTVRARPMLFTPSGATIAPPLDATRTLQQMLEAPVPMSGLPVKITTRAVSSDDDDRVRMLIAAEIGDATDQVTTYHIGLVAIDDKGQVETSSAATTSLSPVRSGRQSPSEFTTSLLLEPGEYSLRLAAIGADGRSGSVHHPIRASLGEWPGGLRSSDLIIASEPKPGGFPRFNASSIVAGPRIVCLFELLHDDPRVLDEVKVRFEAGGATAEASAAPAARVAGAYRRSFASILTMERSEDYKLTATITPANARSVAVERWFHLDANAPTPIAAPFAPETVRRFIEVLEQRGAVSESLVSFVASAKVGRYIGAPDADSRSDADVAMVTFVNALAAVRNDKPALARALLQQTLRKAPGFEGALFYLSLLK